jgi:hypothetical protein
MLKTWAHAFPPGSKSRWWAANSAFTFAIMFNAARRRRALQIECTVGRKLTQR